jgi:hypoxanthine phosphoribosyltransferase
MVRRGFIVVQARDLQALQNTLAPSRTKPLQILPPSRIRFAHPAENAIAELFDRFQIEWQYEPTTFPLVTSEDGRPLNGFTPDFYLPTHNTYIEMTTMRQSLVTRKNRKFRMVRERYPELDVRLLYRRDVELILTRYTNPLQGIDSAGQILISEETISRRIAELGRHLVAETKGSSFTVIALGNGATRTAAELASAIATQIDTPVPTTLLSAHRANPGDFGLAARVNPDSISVLVADVIGTGLTAHSALAWLADRHIPPAALVTLADRRSARLIDVPIFASITQAPSVWLTGAGLDPHGSPHLCQVDPAPK